LVEAAAVDDEVSNELVVDEDDDVVAGAKHRCRSGCVAAAEADEDAIEADRTAVGDDVSGQVGRLVEVAGPRTERVALVRGELSQRPTGR
jgi:hypothetical protein